MTKDLKLEDVQNSGGVLEMSYDGAEWETIGGKDEPEDTDRIEISYGDLKLLIADRLRVKELEETLKIYTDPQYDLR